MSNLAFKNNSTISGIYTLISSIVPYDTLEQEHIADTLAWIHSGAPIFRIHKPDVPNKHLVSYFVVFDEARKKILLVDHIKAQLWLPAGGHVEVDEAPKETARRECIEELGIEAEFWTDAPIFLTSTLTAGMTGRHTDVSLWYVLKGDSDAAYAFDQQEFKDICWFGFDDIPYEKSDPHLKRFVEKLTRTL